MQRFAFETVFDDAGAVAYTPPVKKRAFTAEEVDAARQAGFAEGERSAVAAAEAAHAAALREIAQAATGALGALAAVAHEHKAGCAELSLACGRAIADAALDRFPDAPAEAALRGLIHEVEAAPRLTVRTGAADAARIEAALARVAADAGLPGAIVVKPEAGQARAAFTLDWGDGKASFDPQAAAQRVQAVLHAALAAEGLHGDALIPVHGV